MAKNVLSNLQNLSAVHVLDCRDALRGHIRIWCDGLGRDSSSRGCRGQIWTNKARGGKPQREQTLNVRAALCEKKRASSTCIPCRVGGIGKRWNETMLTRDAARDISEALADMNCIRGADGKNCVTSRVALHPSESKTFSSSPMCGPTKPGLLSVIHVRCRGRRGPSTYQPSVVNNYRKPHLP